MIRSEIAINSAVKQGNIDYVLNSLHKKLNLVYQILQKYKADSVVKILKLKIQKHKKDYADAEAREQKDIYNLLYVGSLELEEFLKSLKRIESGYRTRNY